MDCPYPLSGLSFPNFFKTLVKGEKDGGVFPGLGAENAVNDIQVFFSKKVEGGPEFLPVQVLDAFIEQQIGQPGGGLLPGDLVDLCQNVNAFDKDVFQDDGLCRPVEHLCEEGFGRCVLIQIVLDKVADDRIRVRKING